MSTDWHPEHDEWPLAPAQVIMSDFVTHLDPPVNFMVSANHGQLTVANVGHHPLGIDQLWETLVDVRTALRKAHVAHNLADNVVLGGDDLA